MSRTRKPAAAPSAADYQLAMDMVALWAPKLRRIAGNYNIPQADVQSVARDLALTVRPGSDFTPRWLTAVECEARKQRPGVVYGNLKAEEDKAKPKKKSSGGHGLGWAGGQNMGNASWRLEALESVAEVLAERGTTIGQALGMPTTARELTAALGVSERHARRIKRELEALGAIQADFWGAAL